MTNLSKKTVRAISLLFVALVAAPVGANDDKLAEARARCKVVTDVAAKAREDAERRHDEATQRVANRTKEAANCVERAGQNILRAGIPPTLGSILGVLQDPLGYITDATKNAACNVVNASAAPVIRTGNDVNGAIRNAGSDAQRAFRGGVDDAAGGGGITNGSFYQAPVQQKDPSFWKKMSCNIFGSC